MARASAKIYAPSRPLTVAFLALLAPVCLWGLDMVGFTLLGTLLGMWSGTLSVSLFCGLAMVLPIPFALRGVRAAMVPPVLALLFSILSVLQSRFADGADSMVLLLFALGGVYCVGLSYLFRRARPLLAALDRSHFAPSWLMGLAALLVSIMGFSQLYLQMGNLGFAISAILVAGALPGIIYPRFRTLCICAGLAYAAAGPLSILADGLPQVMPPGEEGLTSLVVMQWSADIALVALTALLLGMALWLNRRQQRRGAE